MAKAKKPILKLIRGGLGDKKEDETQNLDWRKRQFSREQFLEMWRHVSQEEQEELWKQLDGKAAPPIPETRSKPRPQKTKTTPSKKATKTRKRISATTGEKVPWHGLIVSNQPRIRLYRSWDERHHTYHGYNLLIQGSAGPLDATEYTVGIGKGAQAKHQLQAGDVVSGMAVALENTNTEIADFYKVSKLKVVQRATTGITTPPPFIGVPLTLEEYRERGHRRLDARRYSSRCYACVWGCKMPVEITPDHWKRHITKHRTETFCYGPKSCEWYQAGPKRKVPGRRGEQYVEEDWVDKMATEHRGEDE